MVPVMFPVGISSSDVKGRKDASDVVHENGWPPLIKFAETISRAGRIEGLPGGSSSKYLLEERIMVVFVGTVAIDRMEADIPPITDNKVEMSMQTATRK